jgi:HlyD family secretion protein
MKQSSRWLCCSLIFFAAAVFAQPRNVSCLGRIEPFNGVYQLVGPSAMSVVLDLRVDVGDIVAKGDVLATLDNYEVARAELQRATAELDFARKALERERQMKTGTSQARVDAAERDVLVGEAALAAARAQLNREQVKAPVSGQVLVVHAREGERIGTDGLLELGQTDRMYVVAEVYETDIGLVETGQRAVITSPALSEAIEGTVEIIGREVGKIDTLGLDPVARTDSRVVEVKILLDKPEIVSSLTNLQVDVEIRT